MGSGRRLKPVELRVTTVKVTSYNIQFREKGNLNSTNNTEIKFKIYRRKRFGSKLNENKNFFIQTSKSPRQK